MVENNDLLILAVVGMPATGKSEVIKSLKDDYRFFHLYYGDITFEEVKRLGLEINEQNERIAREGLRSSGDMAIYSKLILPKIQQAIRDGYNRILLESMYNIYEYEYIKKEYRDNFKVLAIHSDEDIRIKRLNTRKDRKLTPIELESRQISEAKNLGKGTVIALADYHYVNNGDNMNIFQDELQMLLKTKLGLKSKNFIKNFHGWEVKKKKLHYEEININEFPKKKEVWMISMGVNIGYEQDGEFANFSRPVLIVKKFNNQMFWGIPLSTKQKDFDFYFNFTDPNNMKVSAIISQLRLFSIKRFERKIYDFDQELFDILLIQLKKML